MKLLVPIFYILESEAILFMSTHKVWELCLGLFTFLFSLTVKNPNLPVTLVLFVFV
jgi:hypothetical protein